ncbi:hypothetical protein IWW50_004967 [Coemansia erecta]|nr:hypothetical protein GGF43_001549 [Coemansia sp. RSA 2618]KAJ2820670.1 hypothetical protein IWW50_004967 [Coemansia erecta]
MSGIDDLEYRNFRDIGEVRSAWPIEAAGYPEDEAASLDGMLYRHTNAPHLFFGAFTSNGSIAGYIMSTQSAPPLVTHESMSTHDPQGTTACVHSVCVAPEWQRKGLATKLLNLYTESIREYNRTADVKISRLALISHKYLLPLYEGAGYRLIGVSSVEHGSELWYDCVLDM